jgi:hypothetical protein
MGLSSSINIADTLWIPGPVWNTGQRVENANVRDFDLIEYWKRERADSSPFRYFIGTFTRQVTFVSPGRAAMKTQLHSFDRSIALVQERTRKNFAPYLLRCRAVRYSGWETKTICQLLSLVFEGPNRRKRPAAKIESFKVDDVTVKKAYPTTSVYAHPSGSVTSNTYGGAIWKKEAMACS